MPAAARLTARAAAVEALIPAAEAFPDIPPTLHIEPEGLSPADARLADAVHRTVLRRWLTLRALLDPHLSKPLPRLEPAMQAILLAGAGQLALMERVPAYAVVDEAVSLAKQRVRPKAGGLVNAVLRKVAGLIEAKEPHAPWRPRADELPLERGRLRLNQAILPDPGDRPRYLAAATSHGRALVERWLAQFGFERTLRLCTRGVAHAPTLVAVEPGFAAPGEGRQWVRHEQPGFILWLGDRDGLIELLQAHPARRVQDPAASKALASTRGLAIDSALDLCAGRGTKTRQLAALHPGARLVATDKDAERTRELAEACGKLTNVRP